MGRSGTSLSRTLKAVPSVKGMLILSDSVLYHTRFLIDTGSKYEVALVVTDSLIIDRVQKEKIEYTNHLFGIKKQMGVTSVKYKIDQQVDFIQVDDAFIFYHPKSRLAIFGRREVGVILGIPFFRKFEKVTIDFTHKKLYLLNNLQFQ
jgi:hypothetical protein